MISLICGLVMEDHHHHHHHQQQQQQQACTSLRLSLHHLSQPVSLTSSPWPELCLWLWCLPWRVLSLQRVRGGDFQFKVMHVSPQTMLFCMQCHGPSSVHAELRRPAHIMERVRRVSCQTSSDTGLDGLGGKGGGFSAPAVIQLCYSNIISSSIIIIRAATSSWESL